MIDNWMTEVECYFWHFTECSLHVAVNVSLSSFVILRIAYIIFFNRIVYVTDELIISTVRGITVTMSLLCVGLVYLYKVSDILV